MIRSVIVAIKNNYKPLCKQESDNLWCRGKLLISIKRAMNLSRIELLWLVFVNFWLEIWSHNWRFFITYLMHVFIVNWCFLFVCFSIEPTAPHFNIYCLPSYETKSPAKNLQISSCSIATLSHVCNYKVQFCAFKGNAQNLPLRRVGYDMSQQWWHVNLPWP
jgi:hypothetical protein